MDRFSILRRKEASILHRIQTEIRGVHAQFVETKFQFLQNINTQEALLVASVPESEEIELNTLKQRVGFQSRCLHVRSWYQKKAQQISARKEEIQKRLDVLSHEKRCSLEREDRLMSRVANIAKMRRKARECPETAEIEEFAALKTMFLRRRHS